MRRAFEKGAAIVRTFTDICSAVSAKAESLSVNSDQGMTVLHANTLQWLSESVRIGINTTYVPIDVALVEADTILKPFKYEMAHCAMKDNSEDMPAALFE